MDTYSYRPPHFRFLTDSDRTADIAGGPVRADFVAKVETPTMLKISRKPISRHLRPAGLRNANTKVGGRFGVKRYGPSHRGAREVSVGLKLFVPHPKHTFATISARNRHHQLSRQSPLVPNYRPVGPANLAAVVSPSRQRLRLFEPARASLAQLRRHVSDN